MTITLHGALIGTCLLLLVVSPSCAAASSPIPVLVPVEQGANGRPLPAQTAVPDIISLLAVESGIDLVLRPMPWRRAQLMAERGEGLLYGAAVTPERSRIFTFTRPLDTVNQWLVSTARAPLAFNEWGDVRGKVISILSGARYGADFEARRGSVFSVEQNAATLAGRFGMLRAGRVDAVMVSSYLTAPLLEEKLNCLFPGKIPLLVAGKPIDKEILMFAVPKSGPLSASYTALDAAVGRLAGSGALDAIHLRSATESGCPDKAEP